ncbi:MAG: enoyl-CoA hydratase-related protein [Persicimonas sp.]
MADILYDVDDAIATITLNRPEARNAYSSQMAEELVGALDRAELDEQVRAVIVTGAGPAFCAGGDLKAMRDKSGMFAGDPVELRDNYLRGLQSIPRRFERFEKPVIAAINGHAIGAGLDLSLMCDIRIGSDEAKFGSTFAKVGLIPGDGGAYLLTRVVGFSTAVELILTARIIDADEALEVGLISEVVAREDVLDRARQTAAAIAKLPPKAVKIAKAALYRCVDRDIETSLQLTAALQSCVQRTDEHDQAVADMLDQISGTGD